MVPEFSLEGQVAVVTGAGRSIGRGTALALADAGADVVAVARTASEIERVCEEIRAKGRRALAVQCDVSDEEAVDRMVSRTLEEFGHLDVLVANAGVFQDWKPSEQMTVVEWDVVIGINLRGMMLCCLAAGKAMIGNGGGSIVTVSSIAGLTALPNTLSYTAAKFGVVGLTKALAVDWAKHNVRVNCVAPGFVERDSEPLLDEPAVVEYVTSRTAVGRWGKPRELGLAITFLASPAASFITGATLAVDGGWLAQ